MFAMLYMTGVCIKSYPFMVKCSRAPMDMVNWRAKEGDNVKDPGSNPCSATKLLHDSGKVI